MTKIIENEDHRIIPATEDNDATFSYDKRDGMLYSQDESKSARQDITFSARMIVCLDR